MFSARSQPWPAILEDAAYRQHTHTRGSLPLHPGGLTMCMSDEVVDFCLDSSWFNIETALEALESAATQDVPVHELAEAA